MRFDEEFSPCDVLTVPRSERREQLETVGSRRYYYLNVATIFGGSLIARIINGKTFRRQLFAIRRSEFYGFTLVVKQGIGDRVEV